MTLEGLHDLEYDIATMNHATAVLTRDFAEPLAELEDVLGSFRIHVAELVQGGGGEASFTQRLRHALSDRGWKKHRFTIRKTINGDRRGTTTHEIDHLRRASEGRIALEIEWNNKDPFYDRDLENFQRLHAEGAISVGVIITRGSSLQSSMLAIVTDWADMARIADFGDLERHGVRPTARQQKKIGRARGDSFAEQWARVFVSDKFGASTTHWEKLQERMQRGVGNPCPLLLLGIPSTIVELST